MSDAIEQAADVISTWTNTRAAASGKEWGPWAAAQALANAGLLVSPAQQAVLDAAEVLADDHNGETERDVGVYMSTAVAGVVEAARLLREEQNR